VVSLNAFDGDSEEEFKLIAERCAELGVPCIATDIWAKGGEGGLALADAVRQTLDNGEASYAPLYPLDVPIVEKVETVAKKVYGADGVVWVPAAKRQLADLERLDFGDLPVCMAKTQYSLSDDMNKRGRPEDFVITVREVKVSAGAGFVVVFTGDVMTMPGLGKMPAYKNMRLNDSGEIEGLF
jgi:formate--tetrahydrofolate ligase